MALVLDPPTQPSPGSLLATLSGLKAYLGVNGTAKDVQLSAMLQAASDAIRAYCQQDFQQATRTERHNGLDSFRHATITLNHRPVASLTSIGMACPGSDTYELVTCLARYRVNSDRGSVHGFFPSGFQNIEVVYVGGFAEVPADVQQVVIETAAMIYGNADKNPALKSEKLGDYSWTRAGDGLVITIPQASRLDVYRDDPIL